MIRLIEALNYRCLRYVRQPMGPFHVLVGPNASGKSTFLDVVAFLGEVMSEDPETVFRKRSPNPRDLVWKHDGDRFELAVELTIPETLRKGFDEPVDTVRYQVAIGVNSRTEKIEKAEETILLGKKLGLQDEYDFINSTALTEHHTILAPYTGNNTWFGFCIKNDSVFYSEEVQTEKKQQLILDFSRPKPSDHQQLISLFTTVFAAVSGLTTLKHRFANMLLVFEWLANFLANNTQILTLDSRALRKPSPPGQGATVKPDGSNLPLVVENLKTKNADRFHDWIAHLRTALPDLEDIEVIDRPEDRHRWLRLCYRGDLKVPSWMVSDGTLRLLALTILAYLPDIEGVFLIEEPENGIHPRAVETMVQSLRSVYGAQILLATHSPVVLGVAELDEVLCFDKAKDGSTEIMLGSQHPVLRDWKHDADLGSLFAAGVLG
ncbi:MAG: ATP-binding protein [Pirellulales bacterium]|nr:ATP-binding protein [Pirellulales bacterium]